LNPPRDVGEVRSFVLALLIHALLIAALTWGVNWKRSDTAATFGAELWSSLPPDAAPTPAPPPAPPTQPAPPTPPEPTPLPEPVVKPPVVQAPPEPDPSVDIALEQEKKRKQLKEQQLAKEKLEREQAKILQAQEDKAKLLKAEKLKAEQAKAEKLKAEKLAKAAEAKEAKAEQAKADALKAKQAQQVAKQREDNLKRLNELMTSAGGAPGGNSRATVGGKGQSKTYNAIATAAIRPNVVFTEAFDGNPLAKVEVRLQSDGTIISSRVVQPSGNEGWDKAVLNAVVKTRVMPKDVDGKLPDTILILEFRPRF
jgi:colicin import membrane protein